MAQKINQKQYGKKYSTTEQLTGDVWIDGKPIYRKVINFGTLPNNTSKSVAHGITTIDRLINLYGYSTTGAGIIVPWHYRNRSQQGNAFYIDSANLVGVTSADRSAYTETYIILEYTKT